MDYVRGETHQKYAIEGMAGTYNNINCTGDNILTCVDRDGSSKNAGEQQECSQQGL